jgi:formate/nitrite transporter FocA (FNT family)
VFQYTYIITRFYDKLAWYYVKVSKNKLWKKKIITQQKKVTDASLKRIILREAIVVIMVASTVHTRMQTNNDQAKIILVTI